MMPTLLAKRASSVVYNVLVFCGKPIQCYLHTKGSNLLQYSELLTAKMMKLYSATLLLFLKLLSVTGEPSVHILAENLEQPITSTTLEWVPSNEIDEMNLKNAVVASYQLIHEIKNKTDREDSEATQNESILLEVPVYVCRAKINSVWVSGQLRPKKRVCVVSLYKTVSEYTQFEILISIEGSSRLSWVKKNKYTLVPQGAVISGSGDNAHITFIARHKENISNTEGSLTHNVGKCLPKENLGVFHVVNENNTELQFEDGEILVETEPIRYEFKYIKFDRIRSRYPKKQIELGHTILKNEEDGVQLVESVIGYKYDYYLYWGKGHGLLTGLPFTVFLPNGTQIQGRWAVSQEKKIDDVAAVRRYLPEGTAVNVTLIGNYTESEVPYVATVICIYKDEERRNITIRDTKREHTMLDVAAIYTPAYFLHNNSHVPTTTTTSTTTTTTSTSRTTSTTQEVTPIASPGDLSNEIETERSSNTKRNGSTEPDNHTDRNAPSLMKKDSKEPNGVSPIYNMFSIVTILIIPVIVCRVT